MLYQPAFGLLVDLGDRAFDLVAFGVEVLGAGLLVLNIGFGTVVDHAGQSDVADFFGEVARVGEVKINECFDFGTLKRAGLDVDEQRAGEEWSCFNYGL